MVPERLLKEEDLIIEIDPIHPIQEVIQQIPRRIKQEIRTETKGVTTTGIQEEVTTKTKIQIRNNQSKGNTIIRIKTQIENWMKEEWEEVIGHDLAKYVKKPHI